MSFTTPENLFSLSKQLGDPLNFIMFKDQLPRTFMRGRGYIINMQSRSQGNGTHWIAVFMPLRGKAVYFDSFGMPAPLEVLRVAPNLIWNHIDIQNIDSGYCGEYSLLFLWFMKNFHGTPSQALKAFQSLWDRDPHQNLKRLKEYFARLNVGLH